MSFSFRLFTVAFSPSFLATARIEKRVTARVKKEEKIKSADAARERRKLKGIRSEVGDCEEAAYIERKKTGRRKITRKYDFSPRSLPAQRQIIIEIKRFDEQNIRGKKRIGREKIETYRKKENCGKKHKGAGKRTEAGKLGSKRFRL